MNLRAKLTGLLAITSVAALLAPAVTAQASPIDDKKAQAAHLQAQIDANGEKISALAEQYNGAVYKLDKAQAGIAEAESRTKAAEAETTHIKDLLAGRAAELYKGAGTSNPLGMTDVTSVTEMSARSKYASAAADQDSTLLAKLQKAREDLAAQRTSLEQQRASAQSQKDAATRAKASIAAANAEQQRLLSQTKGELANLIKAEQVRQAAALRARAQGIVSGHGTHARPSPIDPRSIPPVSGAAGVAVRFAYAQIGKPYRFATSGPDTYDCSGLTAAAWGAAGVSLPHYSGAQWDMLPHIPLSAVQPGDLIFYGPGGSRHVEIYVGGGMVITAPQTGDFVKLAPLRSSAIGAGRPG